MINDSQLSVNQYNFYKEKTLDWLLPASVLGLDNNAVLMFPKAINNFSESKSITSGDIIWFDLLLKNKNYIRNGSMFLAIKTFQTLKLENDYRTFNNVAIIRSLSSSDDKVNYLVYNASDGLLSKIPVDFTTDDNNFIKVWSLGNSSSLDKIKNVVGNNF